MSIFEMPIELLGIGLALSAVVVYLQAFVRGAPIKSEGGAWFPPPKDGELNFPALCFLVVILIFCGSIFHILHNEPANFSPEEGVFLLTREHSVPGKTNCPEHTVPAGSVVVGVNSQHNDELGVLGSGVLQRANAGSFFNDDNYWIKGVFALCETTQAQEAKP
ncbi:hypothetical protein So717_15440 [Roseobacter cerasinus]|uniref:Uncharacterized protein n=1 Tax=Roseobacter cerasinus TaxID=2602289 RepID=A0A640VRR5_9RHOB|nr:hypothetical protein [Roseobacter cerasinus]GFE49791.1 hypothetical protein So717_15440 [Roseobacter cerasinus]